MKLAEIAQVTRLAGAWLLVGTSWASSLFRFLGLSCPCDGESTCAGWLATRKSGSVFTHFIPVTCICEIFDPSAPLADEQVTGGGWFLVVVYSKRSIIVD